MLELRRQHGRSRETFANTYVHIVLNHGRSASVIRLGEGHNPQIGKHYSLRSIPSELRGQLLREGEVLTLVSLGSRSGKLRPQLIRSLRSFEKILV